MTDGQGNPHTVHFSRPPLQAVFFRIALTGYEGFDAEAVTAAIQNRLFTYVNLETDIGESINVPQLYGLVYQAAGDYAPTLSITDMSCSGNHGVSRERVVIAWNEKFTMGRLDDVTITVNS